MEFQHASAKFPADYTRPVVNFIVDSETDKIFKKPIGIQLSHASVMKAEF